MLTCFFEEDFGREAGAIAVAEVLDGPARMGDIKEG